MNRVSTEAALRLSILPARSSLTALCLLLVVSFPVRAADPCFYDGVSQSPLDYIIRQISSRYDTPAITDTSDAGHVMPPFMGQGLNQGFKDASNLCWKAALVARGAALVRRSRPWSGACR